MSLHVLVPLRSPGLGKTRLAPRLTPGDRADVAAAMLADVVGVVRAAGLGDPVVVASGRAAAAAGRDLGCPVRTDGPGVGLDGALAAVTATLPADDDVLVLLGDLPRVTPDDLRAVVAASTPVVVAPSDDGGTSALLRRPHACLTTAYGPDSAARHVALATARGLAVTTVRRPGLATDLDTVADLEALDGHGVGSALAGVLAGLPDG